MRVIKYVAGRVWLVGLYKLTEQVLKMVRGIKNSIHWGEIKT
jgi:hypothetical protein